MTSFGNQVQSLFSAARRGDERLFKEGVVGLSATDLNFEGTLNDADGTQYCCTALTIAARNGHHNIISLLLKRGVEVNYRHRKDQSTALLQAAEAGQLKSVEVLRLAGASLNCQRQDGRSALMLAASNGHAEIVRTLLAAGVNGDLKRTEPGVHFQTISESWKAREGGSNHWGATALAEAASAGHAACCRILLDAAVDVNALDDRGWSPLLRAAEHGHAEVVDVLVRAGADIHAMTENDTTALWLAADCGSTASVNILLTAGANINHKSRGVLHDSSATGSSGTGAGDVDIATLRGGRTPLMQAAQKGYEGTVRVLLDNGAKVDGTASNGFTALLWACCNGHTAVVALLLRAGARLLKDSDGGESRELIAAARGGHIDILRMLMGLGLGAVGDGAKSLRCALDRGLKDIVCFLVSAGVSTTTENEFGRTILMEEIEKRRAAGVSLLISARVNVNYQSKKNGWTALMWAAFTFQFEMLNMLLEAKANLELRCQEGNTALMHAAAAGRASVVRLLVEHGACVTCKSRAGLTAEQLADSAKHSTTANILRTAAMNGATKRQAAEIGSASKAARTDTGRVPAGAPLPAATGGYTQAGAQAAWHAYAAPTSLRAPAAPAPASMLPRGAPSTTALYQHPSSAPLNRLSAGAVPINSAAPRAVHVPPVVVSPGARMATTGYLSSAPAVASLSGASQGQMASAAGVGVGRLPATALSTAAAHATVPTAASAPGATAANVVVLSPEHRALLQKCSALTKLFALVPEYQAKRHQRADLKRQFDAACCGDDFECIAHLGLALQEMDRCLSQAALSEAVYHSLGAQREALLREVSGVCHALKARQEFEPMKVLGAQLKALAALNADFNPQINHCSPFCAYLWLL